MAVNRDARTLIDDALSEVELMLKYRSEFYYPSPTFGTVDSGDLEFQVSFLEIDGDRQSCVLGVRVSSKRLRTSICRAKGLRGEDPLVLPKLGNHLAARINQVCPNAGAKLVGRIYEVSEVPEVPLAEDPTRSEINGIQLHLSVNSVLYGDNIRSPSWWWRLMDLRELLLNDERWGNY